MPSIDEDGVCAAEPIAVVGMGMRFPGESHSSEAFWDMLKNGRTGWKPMPKHRYNLDAYYHPDSARAGSIWIKGSHFLSGEYENHAQLFDAPFFNMATTEVNGSDPQQLHMLEVSFEALENAGIPMQTIAGSDTSVYVGCFTRDFEAKGGRDPYTGPFYAATGNGQSMLANRVSWFYDLRGPSMTVDTACSSSLYAVHLACQALRTGESKIAIAGGTNLIIDPSYMRDLTTMGFLSPDGKCHSFDHRANGYARGDGIAAVVLKTLDQALKDGDTIRAVIRNSGLGQDGRTPGITMPSPEAQADLIRQVYRNAGLTLDQTAYFEAHGTGTPIGDPYELSALGATFGKTREADNPLYVGSVKTNIGHLEGCAGLAGFIKAVLVVERGEIPPLADFEKANPRLKLDEWKVALPTEVVPWPVSGVRRVSVNCFGYGGANSHVILDDAYHYLSERQLFGKHQTVIGGSETPALSDDSGFNSAASTPFEDPYGLAVERPKLYLLSSVDQTGVQRSAGALAEFLASKGADEKQDKQLGATLSGTDWDSLLPNLRYTLASKRSFFDHRAFVVARSQTELHEQLQNPLPKFRRGAKNDSLFFIFTGQGAQWASMGKSLLAFDPFRRSLERAQSTLDTLGCTWSLIPELIATKDQSRIDLPEFSQPLCTALQLALVDLLEDWNIRPKTVVGHSSGEIAAAYAAGFLTHEDAVEVSYCRGLFSADVNKRLGDRKGAMMAVALSEAEVEPYVAKVPKGSVVVACINSPNSVTLSGDEVEIDKLEKTIQDDSIFARKLRVKTAYHSPHMEVIAEDYLQSMQNIAPASTNTRATMFSSVTGKVLQAEEVNAAYWVKNMLSPVRFSDAVRALVTQPANPNAKGARRKQAVVYSGMVELGPAEALKGPLAQILTGSDSRLSTSVPYVAMLARNVDAEVSALGAAGKLWSHGISTVDIHHINFPSPPLRSLQTLANLPPYKWNHNKVYEHFSAWGRKNLKREKPRTDLLGMRLDNADASEHRWHNYIRLTEQPWLADHKAQQMVVYPGAAMAVQAIEASRELLDASRPLRGIEVRDVEFKRGLLVPTGDAYVETAIHLKPAPAAHSDEVCYSFRIFSQAGDEPWFEVCAGTVATLYDGEDFGERAAQWQADAALHADIRKRACRTIGANAFYKLFDEKMNLQYGPLHRNVTEAVAGFGEGYGAVTIPDTKAVMPAQFEYPHLIHPATLDSVFHLQALGYLHSLSGEESLVPIRIDKIYVAADIAVAPGTLLKGYSKGLQSVSGDTVGDIVLSDDAFSAPKIVVRGFLSRDLSASTSVGNATAADTRTRKCTRLDYVPLHPEATDESNESAESSTPTAEENASEEKEAAVAKPRLDSLVVIHGSSVSAELSETFAQLRFKFLDVCEDIKFLPLEAVTFGDSSNIKDKVVLSLLEAEEHFVSGWTANQLDWLRNVVSTAECVFWITRGANVQDEDGLNFSATLGLMRTIRVEKPQLRLFQLDLSRASQLSSDRTVDAIFDAFQTSVLSDEKSFEQELVEIDGKLFVPRLVTDDSFHAELSPRLIDPVPTTQEISSLLQPHRGTVAPNGISIHFALDDEASSALGEGEVEVAPSMITCDAAAFESRDSLGRDAVGIITAIGASVRGLFVGDQVVVCSNNSLRTHLRVDAEFVQKLPPFLSPKVAVVMPTAAATAQTALIDLGRLQAGESVLISTAPDALGLFLIQLAIHLGANVFASFETPFHRRMLLEHVGLEESQLIQTSRDADFSQRLRAKNGQRGIDVIVTSQPGDITHQSLSCLAEFGRCISVGAQQHLSSTTPLALGVSVASLDFEHLRAAAPTRAATAFKQAWALARAGVFHPMPTKRVLDLAFFADATTKKLPSALQTPGGAVIRIEPSTEVLALAPPPAELRLDPTATYVLTGGLGGIGRSIAEKMVQAGARKITFLSRSGAKAAEAKRLLASLNERGCDAKAFACDAASAAAVEAFVKGAEARGERIKGVVQCAMVLRDSVFDNMAFDQWVESTQPKIAGSWNLHRFFPKDMDFFIMLSSMAGVIGNPGQANYSAAGTFQDALSVHRRSNGLKSTTIDLGIVSDVGYIAENAEQFERLRYLRPLFISERDLRLLLAAAMLGHTRDGVAVPAQLVTGVGAELMQDGSIGSAMAQDRKYSQLYSGDDKAAGDASEDEAAQEALKAATALPAACEVIEDMFASQVAKAGSMEKEDVDLEKPMHGYGVDSLAAVEVRNMIFRKVRADISVFDILSTMPMRKLAVKVVAKSKFVRNDVQVAAQEESAE